jgi:hypothetical protein
MKTQEQLQKMTDQQLTFELARLVYLTNEGDAVYAAKCGKVGVSDNDGIRYIDINDWSWLMPLAVEHKIDYTFSVSRMLDSFDVIAKDISRKHIARCSDSPQRAIAICLILKLQEIQE